MDTSSILNVARKFISDINEVEHNIYKGTLTVANRPAGVYYFDLNNKPLEDFDAYQERLLAEEFYAHPGSMQWNYYLFMLNDQLGTQAKEAIEKNDKYARKYVLTEDEFTDFFTLEKSDAAIRPNIVAEWKRRLDDAGLQDVYSAKTYVDIISQFKSNTAPAVKKPVERRSKENVDKISFIDKLILKNNYRKYPAERKFDFGKVNLFRGINGVGKTSLFEAIEAMICGKCLRNPTVIMPEGCIAAEFNHSGKLESFDAKNNRLYQSRDLNWYATNTRGNTLFHSFNRFNFFNADAAHDFSTATTEKGATEALFNIILGPEYQYIADRCTGTLDRLRPEFNKLNEEMTTARQKEQRTGRIIKNHREPASLAQLRDTIVSLYTGMKFRSSAIEDELVLIEERNNQLRAVLANLSEAGNTFETKTAYKFGADAFENKRTNLRLKEQELRTLTEKQTTLTALQKQLDNTYDFLRRCLVYVQDEKLMALQDLQMREGSANLLKSKIDFVKELIKGLSTPTDDMLLGSEEIAIDIRNLKKEVENHEAEMKTLMGTLNRLDALVQQIRSHGREFLELDHNASDCPLCRAAYTRQELANRLTQDILDTSKAQPVVFNELRQNIDRQKRLIAKREQTLLQQRQVVQAYSAAFTGEQYTDLTSAMSRLQSFITDEERVNEELQQLAELRRYAETSGRSEKEFQELKFASGQEYGDKVSFSYGSAGDFQKLLDETTRAINTCKNNLEKTTTERLRVGNEIKKLLGVEGDSIYLRDIEDIFKKEQVAMGKIKSGFERLTELIDLSDNVLLSDLEERASALQNHMASQREEQKVQFEFDLAVKENSEASIFITANNNRLLRYERAVATLRALTGDEAAAHVTAFFDDNFQEIVDIFKAIHVPKEFRTLRYVADRLELITENGEIRSISQISTGQRSALALSIFLSLNGKLTNGPDIIMFDDPVAFIDDLNALSFLDYLRVQTLRSGKQIFFATANMRLAGLFEKKFGFLGLGEDFKRFEFTRTQSNPSSLLNN